MDEPEKRKTKVVPIAVGEEIKRRRPTTEQTEQSNEANAIRRLSQCLQMAADLVKEVSRKR